jgi:hypothetical protein
MGTYFYSNNFKESINKIMLPKYTFLNKHISKNHLIENQYFVLSRIITCGKITSARNLRFTLLIIF